MTPRSVLSCAFCLAPLLFCGQTSAQTWANAATQQIATALKDSSAPSVSVAIAEDGKITFAKAFGMADLEHSVPATVETRYAVGSVSKQFTAAALLLLEAEGKLSLDDKVAKYFPQLTHAADISIRQLLQHTSGYEDYAPQDYLIPAWTHATTTHEIMDQYARKPLNFDPGTRRQYSNTGYVVAGAIVEKVSGQGLVAFLRERIFKPLKMDSAGDCNDAVAADATPYTRYALGKPRKIAREAAGWYMGAGELCMTPTDVVRWDLALMDGKVLSAQSFEEMTAEATLSNRDRTHYALGLSTGDYRGIPTLAHDGEVSGFLALNRMFPTRHSAIVLLSNEDGISLIDPLSARLSALLFQPESPTAKPEDLQAVRSIFEGLQQGKIDASKFTPNAQSYFTRQALDDYRDSLGPLGKVKNVRLQGDSLRGGMSHKTYTVETDKKTVIVNSYLLPDGKYEQFMVIESI